MSRRESVPGSGERWQRVRVRLGLTMSEMARRCGVPVATYRRWEVDDAAIGAGTLKAACRAMRVPEWRTLMCWLPDGTGPEPTWLSGSGTVPAADPDADRASPEPAPERVQTIESLKERHDWLRRRGFQIPWQVVLDLATAAKGFARAGQFLEEERARREIRHLLDVDRLHAELERLNAAVPVMEGELSQRTPKIGTRFESRVPREEKK